MTKEEKIKDIQKMWDREKESYPVPIPISQSKWNECSTQFENLTGESLTPDKTLYDKLLEYKNDENRLKSLIIVQSGTDNSNESSNDGNLSLRGIYNNLVNKINNQYSAALNIIDTLLKKLKEPANDYLKHVDEKHQADIDAAFDDVESFSPNIGVCFVSGELTSAFTAPVNEKKEDTETNKEKTKEELAEEISNYVTTVNKNMEKTITVNSLITQGQNAMASTLNTVQGAASSVTQSIAYGAGNVVGSATGIVSGVLGSVGNLPVVIAQATQDLANFALQKGQELIPELMKPPTDRISYWTTTYSAIYMEEIKQKALQKVMENQESINQENIEKKDKKTLNDFNEKISYYASKVKEKTDEYVGTCTDALNKINEFSMAGPQWLNKQITKTIDESRKKISYFFDETKKSVEKTKEEFSMKMGEATARKAADKLEDQLIKSNKENVDNVEKNTKKAKTKAKTVIQDSLMKVMALIGA